MPKPLQEGPNLAELESAAMLSAERVVEYETHLAADVAAEEVATQRHLAALATGAGPAELRPLSQERIRLQLTIANARQDLLAARAAAKSARRTAAEAAFAEERVAVSRVLAERAGKVEEALRALAAAWELYHAADLDARDLRVRIQAHVKRFRLTAEEQPAGAGAGAAALTGNAYSVAREAVTVLRELDSIRRETANPTPQPLARRSPILVGGSGGPTTLPKGLKLTQTTTRNLGARP